jgi:putative membrane protein
MMGAYGFTAGLGWLGMLMMALFWISVIVLVIRALRHGSMVRTLDVGDNVEEILQQRYARGQISREEYIQARQTLR